MKKHHEIVPLVQTKMDVKGSYIECRQQHRKKIADDVPSSQKKKKRHTGEVIYHTTRDTKIKTQSFPKKERTRYELGGRY